MYTVTVPFESFDKALEILSDMLMHANMDPREVEKEREVIYGEMRLHNDNPAQKLSELTFQNAYIRHPYRHPIIGYESILREITKEDLMNYYQDYYTPNNTILSVAGNVKTKEILPKIKRTFKEFKRRSYILRNLPQEPPQISQRRYEEYYPTDLTRLSLTYGSVSLLDPDLFALDVLAKILGQGRSSRLYLEVYKKQGLVHYITASSYTPVDRGVFEIESLLEKKNVEQTIQACFKQIENIKHNGVNKEELEKAKRQVLSEHVMGRQTTSQVTFWQAIDEAFTGDYQFSQKYVDAIGKVNNNDIKRVANKYLIDSALTVVVLKPKEQDQKQSSAIQKIPSGNIQRHTLKNGLTVLLREDHTFPLVSIHLVLSGGTRQETVELNGLSQMTAQMWLKGTKAFSAKHIAEKTEFLGMDLDSYSGRNSLGLSMDLLSEDLDTAFILLEDLVKNPSFPTEELGKVKENMKTSIRQRDDSIFNFTSHALKETLFLNHPYRLEEEGTLESIDRIRRKDLTEFYNRLALPNNMVISIFGDIEPATVIDAVRNKFGSLQYQEVPLTYHTENPPEQPREKNLVMDKEQAMVMLGFHGTKLTDNDRYGIEVLTSILGSSFSGRLFNSIREQFGQSYSLGGYSVPGIDAGFIYFYVLTSDEHVAKVKELLIKEIGVLQSEFVPDQELRDIQTYLKGTFKIGLQTNASLSFNSSLDELYGLGFERYLHYDEMIDQVTPEDLKRLALEYLDLNKSVIVITRPKSQD
jgi:zinc protease